MRLHTDASKSEDVIGLAYVLDDEIENIHISGQQHMIGDYTSMEAEYHALMLGLHTASWHSETMLVILSDCLPLITKMKTDNEHETTGIWRKRQQQCHSVLSTFEMWDMQHIPRERNAEADRMAREALWCGQRKQ